MKVELFPFQKRALANIRMKTAEGVIIGRMPHRWFPLLHLLVQVRQLL